MRLMTKGPQTEVHALGQHTRTYSHTCALLGVAELTRFVHSIAIAWCCYTVDRHGEESMASIQGIWKTLWFYWLVCLTGIWPASWRDKVYIGVEGRQA